MSREEKARTLWRLWLVVIVLVFVIGGCSMWRKAKHESVNKVGRQWVDTTKQSSEATNAEGRTQLPGSGAPGAGGQPGGGAAGGAAQPGAYGQPTTPGAGGAGQPGAYGQPTAPGARGAAGGGRANIPGAGR
jgi:hypothetical protein